MRRIKPSKFATFQSYLIVGLGFAGVDYVSAQIHRVYKADQKETQLLDSLNIQYPLNNHFFRNLLYGIMAANTAQIVHFKFNEFIKQRNQSQLTKLIMSPFAITAYYAFATIFDKRPFLDTTNQFMNDLKLLLPIRLAIDYCRIKGFFFKQQQQMNKIQFVLFLSAKLLNTIVLVNFYENRFN